jgi:hypothetical protein
MRLLVLLAGILCFDSVVMAETARLRKKDNGNIVEVEIVEVQVDRVTFRLPGGEQTHTIAWEGLDTEWIKRNSPAVWNEHELMLKPEPKTETKKEDTGDPFAKETPPADTKELIKNLSSALSDRMKGIDAWTITSFCKTYGIDEAAFWRGYDELRKASGTYVEPKTTDSDKSSSDKKSSRNKDGSKDRQSWERDPAGKAREDLLRAESEKGHTTLNCIGYIRTIADGGYKGRLAWQFLRENTEDRKALATRLRKYETLAGELADRTDKTDAKRDALVLRKLLGDVAASVEKLSKENNTQEEKLKGDCQSLVTRLGTVR